MLSSSMIARISSSLHVLPEPDDWSEDVSTKHLRKILLGCNSVMLTLALVKLAVGVYMIFWIGRFWWGLVCLMLSVFAAGVTGIYFPLIWMSFRLGIVKIVIAFLFLSHILVTCLAVFQVVKDEVKQVAFTALTGLHLAVLFSSFTYYWRLYSA